jgi:hypothetical protein
VPTTEGDLYLKAASLSGTFEPALTVLLADAFPDRIAEPVAIDVERGWDAHAQRGHTGGRVTLRTVAMRFDLEPGGRDLLRLRDAYLEPFGERESLLEAFELAYAIGTIGRALAWHRYVRDSDPRYRSEIAEAVPYGLQRFLEGGPIGTWRWE